MQDISRRELSIRAARAAALMAAGSVVPGLALAQAAAARGSALRLVWPFDTSSLDPVGIGVQRSTWTVSVHIYDRLVSYAVTERPDGTRLYDPNKIVGELAEKWDVAPDGKTITFHLRKNSTFHDGSPVTAEDARWSIARALAVPAAAGVMRLGGITSADQLSVIDANTLQVKLTEANRYSVPVFTIPFAAIFNKKVATQHATPQDPWATEWLKTNSAGGGAFRLASFRPDQVMLMRNDKWASGLMPSMQQVIFQTVPEASLRTALVERNSADIAVEIPPVDYEAVVQRKTANAIAIPMRNHMDFLAFNSNATPFNDLRVRQAVAYALPYEDIFKSVYRGRGIPLYGAKGEVEGGAFPQAHPYSTNLAKAKSLMREAGLASGIDTALGYSVAKAAYFDPISLAVKNSLEKIGVRLTIERLPGAQFDERVAKRSFGLLLENRVAWLSQPDYWLRVFYTGTSTSNLGNYQSEKLQQMLKDLRGDASPQEYVTRTKEMSKLVLNDIPLIPLRQGAVEIVLAKGVSGYTYWFHGLPDARSIKRA